MPLSHEQLMDTVLVGNPETGTVFLMRKSEINAGQNITHGIALMRGSVHPDLFELLHASFLMYHALTNSALGLQHFIEECDKRGQSHMVAWAQALQDPILLAQRAAVVGPDEVIAQTQSEAINKGLRNE